MEPDVILFRAASTFLVVLLAPPFDANFPDLPLPAILFYV